MELCTFQLQPKKYSIYLITFIVLQLRVPQSNKQFKTERKYEISLTKKRISTLPKLFVWFNVLTHLLIAMNFTTATPSAKLNK